MFVVFAFKIKVSIMLKMIHQNYPLNKRSKVVPVGCIGLWKHNGVPSEFRKIREIGKMCHIMSIEIWHFLLLEPKPPVFYFSYMALGIALRYVLEALRKPFGSKMYMFGIAALDRFKTR